MSKRNDEDARAGEWRRMFAGQAYERIKQHVRANMWQWRRQAQESSYTIDDAIGDAVFSLLKKPPEHAYTENDLVRMIVKRAANKLRKHYRREQRKAVLEEGMAQEEMFPPNLFGNPELEHDANAVLDELCKRTGTFSLQTPYVIFRDKWGYTPKEIAEAWHTTVQAVRQTLWRADKNITEILREWDTPPPIGERMMTADFLINAPFCSVFRAAKNIFKVRVIFWLAQGL